MKRLTLKLLCSILILLLLLPLIVSCGQSAPQTDPQNDSTSDVPTGKVYDIDEEALGKSYPLTDLVDVSEIEKAELNEVTFSRGGKNQIYKIDENGIKELIELLKSCQLTPIVPDHLPNTEKQLSCGHLFSLVKPEGDGSYYFTFRESLLKGDKFDHPSIKFYTDNANIAESILAKYE